MVAALDRVSLITGHQASIRVPNTTTSICVHDLDNRGDRGPAVDVFLIVDPITCVLEFFLHFPWLKHHARKPQKYYTPADLQKVRGCIQNSRTSSCLVAWIT